MPATDSVRVRETLRSAQIELDQARTLLGASHAPHERAPVRFDPPHKRKTDKGQRKALLALFGPITPTEL